MPLLLRAHELWPQIEADAGLPIFTRTGGIMVGRPGSRTFSGSVHSAKKWELPHEILDATELRRRFPTMSPAEEELGLYEPGAGFVVPEASVSAHLRLAERAGADLRFSEPVLSWSASERGVRVVTARGRYSAERLVVCLGAWAPELLAGLGVEFTVERQVQYWFAPRGGPQPFEPTRHPVYIWEDADGIQCYGFPALDGAVKIAFFRGGLPCTPDTIDRTVHAGEVEAIAAFAGARMPTVPGEFLRAATCLYTNTSDEHFVIAPHPGHANVVVACGFSGHGFKFVPVVGEVLADLVTEGGTRHPISLFDPARLTRFQGAA